MFVDTTPSIEIVPICDLIETTMVEADLIDQVSELHNRIDSLTYVIKNDTIFLKPK